MKINNITYTLQTNVQIYTKLISRTDAELTSQKQLIESVFCLPLKSALSAHHKHYSGQ